MAQDANSYDRGLLELRTTYYWRVDEVRADGDHRPRRHLVVHGRAVLLSDHERHGHRLQLEQSRTWARKRPSTASGLNAWISTRPWPRTCGSAARPARSPPGSSSRSTRSTRWTRCWSGTRTRRWSPCLASAPRTSRGVLHRRHDVEAVGECELPRPRRSGYTAADRRSGRRRGEVRQADDQQQLGRPVAAVRPERGALLLRSPSGPASRSRPRGAPTWIRR